MKVNKLIKLISTLLAVLMMVSAAAIVVSAAENEGPVYSTNTGGGVPTYDYKTGTYKDANGNNKVIETAEEKIALMDYRYGTDKFELYVDAYSGEVAIRSKSTGETLFTNPYTIGQSKATASSGNTKDELMSQLVVHYTEIKTNQSGKFYSYQWAAERNQISVMNIKGGIRVEYTLGREESKSLLPRMISEEAFLKIVTNIEENINAAIEAGTVADPENEKYRLEKFKAWYTKFSLSETESQQQYEDYCNDYPILKKYAEQAATDPAYENFAIYVLDEKIGERDIKKQEGLIKEYYKEYTFKNLEEDHAFVEYKAETESYPVFRMALEYTIEDSGLVVRLPANGIRFNESLYRLDNIEILPYMGAGMNPNEGYTFFPDGSGTLFDFEKIAVLGTRQQISGKVYGQDYAYHEVSGQYEEVIRYPVFGVYEKEHLTKVVTDENGQETEVSYEKDRGYVAIVEEGDSLIEISSYHGGPTSEYNTIKLSVFPRPTDSYVLADSISVGGSNEPFTVVSARKYTGNYKVRYIMLTDNDVASAATAAGKTAERYYEPSYVGMATAYRDYLSKDLAVLTRLTSEDVGEDIPLYIESFGALQTTEKFLSIPIDVMTPLTTFQDVQTMYENLKASNITNVNFILKGFTKGGMTSPRVPYNLKWERAVSKEMDFEELTEYAKNEGFGLFPDFDFVFSSTNTLFDGLTLDKHAVKTIDDRYSSKREYSATKHTYVSYYELALSPAYFSYFYEKFIPKYEKYSPIGISVSTLGSYLNSDFDEDEPYNRADGKKYTELAFQYIEEELSDEGTEIMTSGGNAYSWKYVDHITDIALDSSRFSVASASVPFLGIVLHGSVQVAGTPVNMEGNIDYAILKSIESGASLKFVLSYRNTDKLKEYETLSQYYSVNYDIWYNNGKGDLISIYHELNEVLSDVQTSIIVGHEYINGKDEDPNKYATRVPDDDELILDATQEIKNAIEYENALESAQSESERKAIYEARQLIIKCSDVLRNSVKSDVSDSLAAKIVALQAIYNGEDGEFDKLVSDVEAALEAYEAVQQFHAIYSDYTDKPTYKVESAISAYEAYVKAPEDAAKKADWDKYAAILGADYTEKLVAMLDAKAASATDANNAELKAAYEAAVAVLDKTPAGVAIDVEKAIEAMNALKTVKETFIAAYEAATDADAKTALKEAYDKDVKALYDELINSGVVYEISYTGKTLEGSKYYGGPRYYRDAAKYEYEQTIAKLNAKLDELYASAAEVMDEQERLNEVYGIAQMEAAIALLKEENAFNEAEIARLEKIYNELVEDMAANQSALDALLAYDVIADMAEAYADYKALVDAAAVSKETQGSFDPVKDYNVDDMTSKFTGVEYTWTEKVTEKVNGSEAIVRPQLNTGKYVASENMVVHETFDNGKEFLLNFNDYRVVVYLNGTYYTLEAYGYVVIKDAKK